MRQLSQQWLGAVLEEYKSLRAEAVTARDAQLSVLRLALPLLVALIGIGVSQKKEDELLAGVLLTIVPVIVGLTFELWLGQVQRTIRLGSVVAAIERRLAELPSDDGAGGADLGRPMGWELWLRRSDGSGSPFGLSPQQRESTVSAAVTFTFFVILAGGSLALGVVFLFDHDNTVGFISLGMVPLVIGYLFVRVRFAVLGLRDRESVPAVGELWFEDGTRAKQGAG
jgi:hypothetical protein